MTVVHSPEAQRERLHLHLHLHGEETHERHRESGQASAAYLGGA